MDAINQNYFNDDEKKSIYLRIASGERAPALVKDAAGFGHWTDWRPGEGGIISPRERVISTGTTLVRFSGHPKWDGKISYGPQDFGMHAAAGAWWLDWSAYKAIEGYADKIGESVALAVRQVCAVPEEWSNMSYVVQATTRSPIGAWTGLGRVGGDIDPLAPGKPLIKQLYLPGMFEPDLNKAAVLVHSHGPLDPEMAKPGARKAAEQHAQMQARLRAALGRA